MPVLLRAAVGPEAGRIIVNGTPHDQLLEKISRLPPERVAEVEDFVDFIAQRDTDRELVRASARASEAAFSKAWSNPEDDVYDRMD